MEYNQQYDRDRMLANAQYPNMNDPYYYNQGYPPQQGYPQQNAMQLDYYGQGQTGYPGPMVQPGMNLPTTSQVKATVNNILDRTGFSQSHNEYVTIKVPEVAHSTFKKCFNRKTPREPVPTICTKCNQQIFTQPTSEIGFGVCVSSASFCICCPLFFWCPFLIDECYDHSHKCPSCGNVIMKERFMIG